MFPSTHFLSFKVPTHWAKHVNVLYSHHHPTYNPEAEMGILGVFMEECLSVGMTCKGWQSLLRKGRC